jgi:hypothetical protein
MCADQPKLADHVEALALSKRAIPYMTECGLTYVLVARARQTGGRHRDPETQSRTTENSRKPRGGSIRPSACQRSLVSPGWRPGVVLAGGHQRFLVATCTALAGVTVTKLNGVAPTVA